MRKPPLVQLSVDAALFQEFCMTPAPTDAALLYEQYLIGLENG
jgi:hypothetical protein